MLLGGWISYGTCDNVQVTKGAHVHPYSIKKTVNWGWEALMYRHWYSERSLRLGKANRSRVYLVLPDSLKKTGHDQENCLKVHFCSDYGNCIFLKCNKIASKQGITDLSSFKCEVMYSQRSGKKQKKEFQ